MTPKSSAAPSQRLGRGGVLSLICNSPFYRFQCSILLSTPFEAAGNTPYQSIPCPKPPVTGPLWAARAAYGQTILSAAARLRPAAREGGSGGRP